MEFLETISYALYHRRINLVAIYRYYHENEGTRNDMPGGVSLTRFILYKEGFITKDLWKAYVADPQFVELKEKRNRRRGVNA